MMNFFLYWRNKKGVTEVVTPKLDGTLLPGITRLSVIDLLKEDKVKVTEKLISIQDVVDALKEKRMLECFGTGTAAVTHPISSITYKGTEYSVPIGTLSGQLKTRLQDIQYGKVKHSWGKVIDTY